MSHAEAQWHREEGQDLRNGLSVLIGRLLKWEYQYQPGYDYSKIVRCVRCRKSVACYVVIEFDALY